MQDFFEGIWNSLDLFYNDAKVLKTERVSKYLLNELEFPPLELRTPPYLESNLDLTIDSDLEKHPNKNFNDSYELFDIKMTSKIPIYIQNQNKTFQELDQIIKTELVSNNILPKIYKSQPDLEKKRIICMEDTFLDYFGFYLNILKFRDKNLNSKSISKNIYAILNRLLSIFEYFNGIELTPAIKNHISSFFRDLKQISNEFDWKDDMLIKLKKVNEFLNFKII